MSDDPQIAIDLTEDERSFMASSLREWGGPARGARAFYDRYLVYLLPEN